MSGHLRNALRLRYPAPAWALLEEVKNRTGYGGKERYADALAMSLYPTRGLDLLGFEIKVSRRDWIKERDSPDKADVIASFCDEWWIVVDDPNIVADLSELPSTWGLLVMDGSARLQVKKRAKKLKAKKLDRPFVAAIMRRVAESEQHVIASYVPIGDVAKRVIDGVEGQLATQIEKAVNEAKHKWERESGVASLQAKAAWAERVSQISGIPLYSVWQLEQIGPALSEFAKTDPKRLRDELEYRASALAQASEALNLAAKAMRGPSE